MQNKATRMIAMLMMVCLLIGIVPFGALATESSGNVWFAGQQLSLGDDLDMHYYVFIDGSYTESAVMNVTVGESTESYPIGNMTADENGYYEFTVALAAAQMADEIHLSMMEGEKEIASKTYSVQGYAKVLLEENYDASVKTMVKAMLNYGAKAQTYFGYNADNLANAGYEMENVSVPAERLAVKVDGAVNGIRFYGASLVYTSKVAIRYYFTADSVEGLTFKDGETSYDAAQKNGLYYVEIPGINPQNYDDVVDLVVSDGASNLTVGYSPMHYITRMYHKDSSSEAFKALLGAMYTYYETACQYVGNDSAVNEAYIAVEDLYIRDPYVLTENGIYYLYGTRGFGQFEVFTSTDLKTWKAHKPCFVGADDFWGNASANIEGAEAAYWAPEVHKYNGAYYMIATFTQSGTTNQQASAILKADNPLGPFQLWSDGAITPAGHSCLDATLYIENGTPYLIYAHEWQCSCKNYSGTGTMDYIQLSADLKTTVGTSSQWFGADELTSFWEELFGTRASNVTDGPFVYTDEAGQKYLLWATSMDTDSGRKYSALATRFDSVGSDVNLRNDTIKLYTKDGGHSMIFTDLDGKETLVLHTPNSGDTRAKFFNVLLRDGGLVLTDRNSNLVLSGAENFNTAEIDFGKVTYTGTEHGALELNTPVAAEDNVYIEAVLKKGAEFDMTDLRYGFRLANVEFNLISNDKEGVALQMTDWDCYRTAALSQAQLAAFSGDGLRVGAARIDGIYYLYAEENGAMKCVMRHVWTNRADAALNPVICAWSNAKGAEFTELNWKVGQSVLPADAESVSAIISGAASYEISADKVVYTDSAEAYLEFNAPVCYNDDVYVETVLKMGSQFDMDNLRYGFRLYDLEFNLVSDANGAYLQMTDWSFYENYTLNSEQISAFVGDGLRVAVARVDGEYRMYIEINGRMKCVATHYDWDRAYSEFNVTLHTWATAAGAEYGELYWNIGANAVPDKVQSAGMVISGFESYNADELNTGKVIYTGSEEAALELNAYVGADADAYMETVLKKGAEFNMSDLRYGFRFGDIEMNLVSNAEGIYLQMTDWNFYEDYILSDAQIAAFENEGLRVAAARVDGVYYLYVENSGNMQCAAKKDIPEKARTSFNLKLNAWPTAKNAAYASLAWKTGINVLPDEIASANLAWSGMESYDISQLNTGKVIYTGDYEAGVELNAWVSAEDDAYIETVLKQGAEFNMSDLRYGFRLADMEFDLVSNADGIYLQMTDWNFYENYFLNDAQKAAFAGNGLRVAAARIDGVYYLYAEDNGEMKTALTKEISEEANAEFNLKLQTWPNAKGAEYSDITWKIGDFATLQNLSGKYVSILGDSISTYQGISNVGTTNTTIEGYSVWYNGNWQNVLGSSDETYWGKVMSKYNMNLLVNNSCGGNKLTEAGGTGVTVPAGYVRVENLAANTGSLNGTTPDKILIFMGTNDYIGGVAAETFKQAYITTLDKAGQLYPNAQIFAFTLIPSHYNTDFALLDAYNTVIRELAASYESVVLVDIAADSGITTENYWNYTFDGTHPNKAGIAKIAEVLEQAILDNMVAEEPEAADTYNMNFEDAEIGNYLVQDGNGLWMDQYDKGWSWVDADAETGNKYLVLSGAEGDATVDFWFNGVTAGSTVEFDFRMPSASAGWDRLAVALGSSDVNYSWRFEQWQGWTSVKYPDWDGNEQAVNEAFQIGTWYSVKMEWSGDGISVKLWQQGAEEPAQYNYITWNSAFAAGSDVRFNFVTNAQSYLHLDNIRIYTEN